MAETRRDKTGKEPGLPFDLVIDVTRGVGRGLRGRLVADAAALQRTAALLEIPQVNKLVCDYGLTARGHDKFFCEGAIRGEVVQLCVVSGEPVEQSVEVAFKTLFWPREEAERWWQNADLQHMLDDIEVEPFDGAHIELGRHVYEVFAATIDPYPRKSGARFAPPQTAPSVSSAKDSQDHPFAALKALKRPLK